MFGSNGGSLEPAALLPSPFRPNPNESRFEVLFLADDVGCGVENDRPGAGLESSSRECADPL